MTHKRIKFWPWLIDYTVFFFTDPDGAPVSHWHKYFASCRRVWRSIRATEQMRDECQDVFEWGVVRSEIVADIERDIAERQAKICRPPQK